MNSFLYANDQFIMVMSNQDKQIVHEAENKLQKHIKEIANKTNIVNLQDAYTLKVGPFNHPRNLTINFLKIREIFPESFIMDVFKKHHPTIKKIEKIVYVEKEDETLWRALFGLALIGIIALFLSSDQLKNLKEKHLQIQKRQDEIETRQTLLIEKMGEQIQEVALKSVKKEKLLLGTDLVKINQDAFKAQIETLKKCDEDLLRTTYEMIDFLKIKSGNVVIKEEIFQLSGMLHKLTNALSAILHKKKHTLSYHIQPNITRYLVGDTGRILQVLRNLLSDVLAEEEGHDVILSIQIKDEENLVFSIINESQFLSEQEIEDMFFPCSWEELQETNKEFSFFVLKELISSMRGKLFITSHKRQGTKYEMTLPYIKDIDNRDGKKKLREVLSTKKALVIEDNREKAKNLIMILESFGIEIIFNTSDHLAKYRPDITGIDFVVIREEDITKKVFDYFKSVNQDNILDIVIIHNIFVTEKIFDRAIHLADATLFQPLIIGDVQEVLAELCIKKDKKKKITITEELQHFKILDNVNAVRDDFKVFKNKHVLLVEDNVVSQQFLSIILSASDLTVSQVSNGLEALLFLSEHPNVDLLLLDIDMPIMDGYEVASKIRADQNIKDIPIIAVTGLGFSSELEKMVLSGINHCIIKPFKIGQVYTALQKVFNEREVPLHQIKRKEKKYIIDTDKGLAYVGNLLFYKEFIEQVLLTLKDSDSLIETMIKKNEIGKLRAFCVDALGLSGTIGAVRF
jgi:CheY-like chemotaxis protein/predicted RNA-binding protein Jag